MRPLLARRLTLCALLAAVAMILSYLEGLLPFPMPVPGLKIGLANVATLFALAHLSLYEAASVLLVRCLLTALLFGGVASLPYSLAGGFLALAAMALARRSGWFSLYGVGIAGAASHNAAQVALAALLLQSPALFSYLAALLPASLATGAAVALIARFFERAMAPALRAIERKDAL